MLRWEESLCQVSHNLKSLSLNSCLGVPTGALLAAAVRCGASLAYLSIDQWETSLESVVAALHHLVHLEYLSFCYYRVWSTQQEKRNFVANLAKATQLRTLKLSFNMIANYVRQCMQLYNCRGK